MSRAFYRIKRSDWPLLVDDGEGGQVESSPDAVALGGTQALLIVHSAIYPNPALEALTNSKFLGNTFAELMSNGDATATQLSNVFETEWEDGVDADGEPIRGRAKTGNVRTGATIRRTNLIPHSWGARESVHEQAAVDALST